jgi:hypothetical protein
MVRALTSSTLTDLDRLALARVTKRPVTSVFARCLHGAPLAPEPTELSRAIANARERKQTQANASKRKQTLTLVLTLTPLAPHRRRINEESFN